MQVRGRHQGQIRDARQQGLGRDETIAVLLVRLHLGGFWWGDVSLSNTLFKRNAGEFAAYLVDAETGELHDRLTTGQREHDLDIARVYIAGEIMDIQAGGYADETIDPVALSDEIMRRYGELWELLTRTERFERGQRWRVEERIRQLNDAGFDVGELDISTDIDGTHLQIQPMIVEAGHHSRRLLALTGLDVEENQARRLLNDLDAFAASQDRQNDDVELVAHDWLARIYEPITRTVPAPMRGKLEPAEVFHEVLEHRWYLSERARHDVSIETAVQDYVATILPGKPEEISIVGTDPDERPVRAALTDPPRG